MNTYYRILTSTERDKLTEADIAQHRDVKRLLYAHQQARDLLHKRPLYRDPKAFLALLLIVLLAIILAEVVEKEREQPAPGGVEQQDPVAPVGP